MKWGTSIQKNLIQWSDEHVLKKFQYCEEKYMFTKSFNILKKSECTEEASMNGSDVHLLKKLK